jgi:hypothetical protein
MSPFRLLAPSFASLVFLATLALTVAAGGALISGDGDTARHIVLGEYILSARALPQTNFFSYTQADVSLVDHEWLTEIATALVHRVLGLGGVALLHGSAIALSISLVFSNARRRGVGLFLALAITALGAAAASIHWAARPHVFTFVGLAMTTVLLERWWCGEAGNRSLLLVAPLFALWVNLHGGFVAGLAVCACYVVADVARALVGPDAVRPAARRRLTWLVPAALLAALATLVGPHGIETYTRLPEYLSSTTVMANNQEFMPPDLRAGNARPFLLMLGLLLAGAGWSRRRLSLHEGLLLIGLLYGALSSARNVALFALVAAPILGELLSGLPISSPGRALSGVVRFFGARQAVYDRLDRRAGSLAWPVAAISAFAVLALVQRAPDGASLGVTWDRQRLPVDAMTALSSVNPPGNGFNAQHWGGFLLFAQRSPFIDSEISANNEALQREYLNVTRLGPGWTETLDTHDVRWVLFPSGTRLAKALSADPSWHVLHADAVAVLLTRDRA